MQRDPPWADKITPIDVYNILGSVDMWTEVGYVNKIIVSGRKQFKMTLLV